MTEAEKMLHGVAQQLLDGAITAHECINKVIMIHLSHGDQLKAEHDAMVVPETPWVDGDWEVAQ